MQRTKLILSTFALTLSTFLIVACGQFVPGLVLLTLFSCATNQVHARLCAVTLSVPEILKDILDAFKVGCPELFGPGGFAKDFSSNTAAIGDTITAKIAHVPAAADSDENNRGFYNGAQNVTTLIEDVPVTLNEIAHVPVKIPYLTDLATKGVDLYKAGVANIGFALGKKVIDNVLVQAEAGCSNSFSLSPWQFNFNALDGPVRGQCNSQKMSNKTRWALIGSEYAAELGVDDRVRSSLFVGELNASEGYRLWKNLGGFAWVREYPDVINAGNEVGGIIGDHRFALVAVRKLQDIENAAKSLGIKAMMKFYPLRDEDTGLELCGISWQEGGTGDIYLSVAILYGVTCGNGGGAPGTRTDDAGLILRTV